MDAERVLLGAAVGNDASGVGESGGPFEAYEVLLFFFSSCALSTTTRRSRREARLSGRAWICSCVAQRSTTARLSSTVRKL